MNGIYGEKEGQVVYTAYLKNLQTAVSNQMKRSISLAGTSEHGPVKSDVKKLIIAYQPQHSITKKDVLKHFPKLDPNTLALRLSKNTQLPFDNNALFPKPLYDQLTKSYTQQQVLSAPLAQPPRTKTPTVASESMISASTPQVPPSPVALLHPTNCFVY